MRALSASSPLPRVTSRRWVERCWAAIRQARRCDTWKRSCNMTTALRRATGSEVSPGDLLKGVDLELLVGHDALETRVLVAELLEALGVVGL